MSARRPTFVILTEGHLSLEGSKTASSALRYLPERVSAVLDSEHAGRDVSEILGFGEGVPVVGDLEAALETRPRPEALLIGVAPQGGALPEPWHALVVRSVRAGLDVWSGLHTFLADDPELARLARDNDVELRDLRRPPDDLPIATGRASETDAFRVATVGTDSNVGKMTTSLELRRGLEARGVTAGFAATGQTGILVEGTGIAVDAVVSDFLAGAAERVTLEAARAREREPAPDAVLVEGQGSLLHPGYSGVTLGLLHGSMPQALVLCWMPGRSTIYGGPYDRVEIPPIEKVVALYEEALAWVRPPGPGRVVGISCATYDLPEDEARRHVREARERTGLAVTDPIRFGVEPLVEAVVEAMEAGDG
ncbi:MAG: DUF1611 domain-containing protein [Gemmatimonadota bacterium]